MARRVRREIIEDDPMDVRDRIVIRERRGYVAPNPIAVVLAVVIGLFLLWLIFGLLL
jgi:hypothetical protein